MYVGLARTMYIRCTYGIFSWEITIQLYTVGIHGSGHAYVYSVISLSKAAVFTLCIYGSGQPYIYTPCIYGSGQPYIHTPCIYGSGQPYIYTPCILYLWFWPTLHITYTTPAHSPLVVQLLQNGQRLHGDARHHFL